MQQEEERTRLSRRLSQEAIDLAVGVGEEGVSRPLPSLPGLPMTWRPSIVSGGLS